MLLKKQTCSRVCWDMVYIYIHKVQILLCTGHCVYLQRDLAEKQPEQPEKNQIIWLFINSLLVISTCMYRIILHQPYILRAEKHKRRSQLSGTNECTTKKTVQ